MTQFVIYFKSYIMCYSINISFVLYRVRIEYLDLSLSWTIFFPSFTDPCTYNDYAHVQYRAFEGTNCQKFCKCTPLATAADGTITYYWQRFFCAPGTLWDQHKLACVHAVGYTCSKYLQTITTNNIGLTCTERSPYIKNFMFIQLLF